MCTGKEVQGYLQVAVFRGQASAARALTTSCADRTASILLRAATGKFAPENISFPANLVTDCVANNNGAGVLLPDNRTLVQMQPLYVPEAGKPIIAWWHTGAPQPFPWTMDILGDGNLGAHGGSGLSAFGGSIRQGELLPGAPPINHGAWR